MIFSDFLLTNHEFLLNLEVKYIKPLREEVIW